MPEETSPEEEAKLAVAAGASGIILTDTDKGEIEKEAAEIVENAPELKPATAPRRGRPKKKEAVADVELLERRLAEVEAKLAAHAIDTHKCHMCHKHGAVIQRGNTKEWFHAPCLSDYKQGQKPLPVPE